jgi:hypothetical protein
VGLSDAGSGISGLLLPFILDLSFLDMNQVELVLGFCSQD